VGDVVLVPSGVTFGGHCAALMEQPTPHLLGMAPGDGHVTLAAHRAPTPIRVSRRSFAGLARYRFLEDPEYAS